MSDSVRPHRQQPTRLARPWDSPGKSTGVGCHFLLQCMKVKSESEVTQLCPTLSDPMDCSLLGSSVHGIFQARVPRSAESYSNAFQLNQDSLETATTKVSRMDLCCNVCHTAFVCVEKSDTGDCRVRELEKVRFRKRTRPALPRNL